MIFWRMRKRRAMTEQYEKVDEKNEFFEVQEYNTKFLVNLVDYLDTGLFLDHRETRQIVAKMCPQKDYSTCLHIQGHSAFMQQYMEPSSQRASTSLTPTQHGQKRTCYLMAYL